MIMSLWRQRCCSSGPFLLPTVCSGTGFYCLNLARGILEDIIWQVILISGIEKCQKRKQFLQLTVQLGFTQSSINHLNFFNRETFYTLQKGDRKNKPTNPKREVIFMELSLPILPRLSFLRFPYYDCISFPNDIHRNLYQHFCDIKIARFFSTYNIYNQKYSKCVHNLIAH